jgi:plasmid stability protein
MATLYVENVPDDIYATLRKKAREKRSSIAAEIVALLRQHYPTEAELKKRREVFRRLTKLREARPPGSGPFPSTEELIREDRER